MTRRAYLYFVITFIIGIILGGIGTYYYGWNTGHWHRRWSEDRFIHNMTRDLNLTHPQVPELRSIIDEHIKEYHALQESDRPKFEALHEQTDSHIRQILNPAQLKKFNEFVEAHKRAEKSR
ncbi:MAG: hypothetical protein ACRD2B_18380 [Terriglobia bacterium]